MTPFERDRFETALLQYSEALELHGDESDEAIESLITVFMCAPPEFLEGALAISKHLQQLPTPRAFNDNNQPLYEIADVAKLLNIDEEKAIAAFHRLHREQPQELPVHLVQ
ncbi:hypothetical protein HQ393_10415 [Chitinibacter bivalviorum]|uniref:Uncharacterized protein n=1 Tax=Chitinibacter bivalviorum TaxID=2739434 RepID=A0A7H9BIY6_9NEIS|nr:hypothetical protein [Chitinibacter bivalviorum]QLG88617.1 hypothetical protein HQ393_10415 [Chitinibacter bivalviorum]